MLPPLSSGRLRRDGSRHGGCPDKDEAAAFLRPVVSVCEKWCVLFADRGHFGGGGPSSRPPCIGPFIAPSSIFIAALLSSPIGAQLAVTDRSLHQSHASLCGSITISQRLHPTLYNGFFAFFFFFFLTQWLKKKEEEEERVEEKENCSYWWQIQVDGGCESIDSLGNSCRVSVVNSGQQLMVGGWMGDEMMGG